MGVIFLNRGKTVRESPFHRFGLELGNPRGGKHFAWFSLLSHLRTVSL